MCTQIYINTYGMLAILAQAGSLYLGTQHSAPHCTAWPCDPSFNFIIWALKPYEDLSLLIPYLQSTPQIASASNHKAPSWSGVPNLKIPDFFSNASMLLILKVRIKDPFIIISFAHELIELPHLCLIQLSSNASRPSPGCFVRFSIPCATWLHGQARTGAAHWSSGDVLFVLWASWASFFPNHLS